MFQVADLSTTFEDGSISNLAKVNCMHNNKSFLEKKFIFKNHLQMEDYDPGKICGLLIKNIQDKHYGNWT